jgi:hypothetical protein
MGVARSILAEWERAADAATDAAVRADASPTPFNEHAYATLLATMTGRWDTLIEWLDYADLRGSSFDPTTDLYLAVTVTR